MRRRHMMTSFPPDPEARMAKRGRSYGGVTSLSCSDFRLSIYNLMPPLTASHVTSLYMTSLPTE